MITIRPIRVEEIPSRKTYHPFCGLCHIWLERKPGECIRHFESTGEFTDMDQVETHYFQNDGLFLAALDDDTLIGSGAISKAGL